MVSQSSDGPSRLEIEALERIASKTLVPDDIWRSGSWMALSSEVSARRLNSAYPHGEPEEGREQAIVDVERFYHQRDRDSIFKLAVREGRHPLQGALEPRGYVPEARTLVLVMELRSDRPIGEAGLVAPPPAESWFTARARIADWDDAKRAEATHAITPRECPVGFSMIDEGGIVSQGQGVVVNEWLGVTNMYTDPKMRRQGYGRRILESLLTWGGEYGARQAFLQVSADNGAAIQMYTEAGFEHEYEYSYFRQVASAHA